jgi:hypothetical protein
MYTLRPSNLGLAQAAADSVGVDNAFYDMDFSSLTASAALEGETSLKKISSGIKRKREPDLGL